MDDIIIETAKDNKMRNTHQQELEIAEVNQRVAMMPEDMQRIFVGMCCGAGAMKPPPVVRLLTKIKRIGMTSPQAKNAWWINYMSTHRHTSATTLDQHLKWMNHSYNLIEPSPFEAMLRGSRMLTEHMDT